MSTWKVRQAGAARTQATTTPAAILTGLRDGTWEPTDEVMAPGDTEWVTIEAHPYFEEAMLDIEPAPPQYEQDESRLDMNPLIDVALVLLIFFILTTSYASLRRVIDLPTTQDPDEGAQEVVIQREEVESDMIVVTARTESGKPVIEIEGKRVSESELPTAIADEMKRSGKKKLIYEAKNVQWGTVVAILDAAKGAGVQEVLRNTGPPIEIEE